MSCLYVAKLEAIILCKNSEYNLEIEEICIVFINKLMDILLVPKHAFQHFLIVLTMFLVNVYVVFNNVFDELPFSFT